MDAADATAAAAAAAGDAPPRPCVVIIGGQFAGLRARHLLEDAFDVTLIDNKACFEYTPGVPRCLVDTEHAATLLVPHAPAVVCASVVAVHTHTGGASGGYVSLSDGGRLKFDYCVLATGSAYPGPFKAQHKHKVTTRDERLAELQAAATALQVAGSVVVVGGGAVGVEVAAEVAGQYGLAKRVVLLSSSDRLLPSLPPRAGEYAASWLAERGVEVLTGHTLDLADWEEYANSAGPHVLQTSQGMVLKADVVYNCTGVRPAAGLAATLGDGAAAHAGGVHVLPTLQVEGESCVFAAGDCTAGSHERTALAADLQAGLVARNIKRLAAGQPLLRWPQDACYGAERHCRQEVISLHKHDGVMVVGERVVLTGPLAAWVKAGLERTQLQVASSWWAAMLWVVLEACSVWLTSWLV